MSHPLRVERNGQRAALSGAVLVARPSRRATRSIPAVGPDVSAAGAGALPAAADRRRAGGERAGRVLVDGGQVRAERAAPARA